MEKMYDKQMNFDLRSSQGFPFCPECGADLHWECDYMLFSEPGYIPAKEGVELDPEDHAVNTLFCPHCQRYYEVEQADDGEHLLCMMEAVDEMGDEVPVYYTEYAINKYDKGDGEQDIF